MRDRGPSLPLDARTLALRARVAWSLDTVARDACTLDPIRMLLALHRVSSRVALTNFAPRTVGQLHPAPCPVLPLDEELNRDRLAVLIVAALMPRERRFQKLRSAVHAP